VFKVQVINPELVDIYQRTGTVLGLTPEHANVYIEDDNNNTVMHQIDLNDLIWKLNGNIILTIGEQQQ